MVGADLDGLPPDAVRRVGAVHPDDEHPAGRPRGSSGGDVQADRASAASHGPGAAAPAAHRSGADAAVGQRGHVVDQGLVRG